MKKLPSLQIPLRKCNNYKVQGQQISVDQKIKITSNCNSRNSRKTMSFPEPPNRLVCQNTSELEWCPLLKQPWPPYTCRMVVPRITPKTAINMVIKLLIIELFNKFSYPGIVLEQMNEIDDIYSIVKLGTCIILILSNLFLFSAFNV